MRRMKVAPFGIACLGFVTIASLATSATARRSSRPTPDAALRSALERAAIAAQSDSHGSVAGARIDGTDYWIVYMRTAGGCGSGGCVPQLWRREAGRFVRSGSVQVSELPISILPATSAGMPMLGVTTFDKESGGNVVRPFAFDGRTYAPAADAGPVPARAGRPLLTGSMLRRF